MCCESRNNSIEISVAYPTNDRTSLVLLMAGWVLQEAWYQYHLREWSFNFRAVNDTVKLNVSKGFGFVTDLRRQKYYLVLGMLLLAGCSSDPNQQKAKHLSRGETYLKDGKYQEAVIEFRNAIQIDRKFVQAHRRLAQTYLSLNNRDAALREFEEAVALDPANSDTQLTLAQLLIGRRQYDEAQAAVDKVLAAEPSNARAHAVLAEKYSSMRALPNAIAELQKAIDIDPTHIEYYASLGAFELAAGRPSDAETTYVDAVQKLPNSVDAHMTLGQFYLSHGRTGESEAELRAASKLSSSAVLPRLLLGRLYEATGRLADAEKVYVDLKSSASDDPLAYQALGLFYASTGQKEKAIAELRSVVASKPKDDGLKLQLAETLIDLRRIQEAKPLVQQLIAANASSRVLLANGRIFIAEGNYQQAVSELERATKSDTNSSGNYYFLGLAQRSLGLSDSAKASFSRALELNPRMTEAAAALSDFQVKRGNYDESLRLADLAAKNQNSPLGYYASAQTLLAKGDIRQGEGMLRTALERDPTSLPSLALMVRLYSQQGKTKDVAQRISQLLTQHPQNAGLHFLLAVSYFDLKELDKSEASLRQAMALDPKTADAYTLLANIDYAKGSLDKAKTDLRTAIENDPRKLVNYLVLEAWYKKEGNWDESKKLIEKAHQIDSTSPQVAMELAFLYLEHGGDVNLALALAQTAKQKLPNDPAAIDILGWSYYKLGSAKLAVTQLEQSVRKAPNYAVYHYHLGMAYMAAGQPSAAKQSLKQALGRDPKFDYATTAKAALEQISKGGGL